MQLLPYTIDFSYSNPNDPHQPQPIQIQPGQVNVNSTSLNLPGKGRVDYGEHYNENLVRMLEHFSSPTAPANPIRGQIWYNLLSTPPALGVFSSNQTSTGWPTGWVQLMTTGGSDRFHVPVVDLLPSTDLVAGDIVYNSTTEKLYVCVELNDGSKQWLTVATQEWSETQLIIDGGTVAFV